jgi:hypothetical protein
VRKDATVGGGSFELVELDLASLKNVRACADGLLAKGEVSKPYVQFTTTN